MKRLHIHVSVDDFDQSIEFYSTLFAAPPTKLYPEYAKWMLDDPRVNFVLGNRSSRKGVDHLGIQVETEEELHEVYERLKRADAPKLEEGNVECCYAQSEKSWIADPTGISWEVFRTQGEATQYGCGIHAHDPLTANDAAAEGTTATTDTADEEPTPATPPSNETPSPRARCC